MNSQASPQRLAEWPATDAVDMLELLTTGVIVLDESLRLERINPAAEVLLDVSARQAIAMPLAQALPANHGLVAAIERTAFSAAVLSEREFSLMSAVRTATHGRPDGNATQRAWRAGRIPYRIAAARPPPAHFPRGIFGCTRGGSTECGSRVGS